MRTNSIVQPERTTMRFPQGVRAKLKELSAGKPGGMTGIVVRLIEEEYKRMKRIRENSNER